MHLPIPAIPTANANDIFVGRATVAAPSSIMASATASSLGWANTTAVAATNTASSIITAAPSTSPSPVSPESPASPALLPVLAMSLITATPDTTTTSAAPTTSTCKAAHAFDFSCETEKGTLFGVCMGSSILVFMVGLLVAGVARRQGRARRWPRYWARLREKRDRKKNGGPAETILGGGGGPGSDADVEKGLAEGQPDHQADEQDQARPGSTVSSSRPPTIPSIFSNPDDIGEFAAAIAGIGIDISDSSGSGSATSGHATPFSEDVSSSSSVDNEEESKPSTSTTITTAAATPTNGCSDSDGITTSPKPVYNKPGSSSLARSNAVAGWAQATAMIANTTTSPTILANRAANTGFLILNGPTPAAAAAAAAAKPQRAELCELRGGGGGSGEEQVACIVEAAAREFAETRGRWDLYCQQCGGGDDCSC